jgi:hypothetical protein
MAKWVAERTTFTNIVQLFSPYILPYYRTYDERPQGHLIKYHGTLVLQVADLSVERYMKEQKKE